MVNILNQNNAPKTDAGLNVGRLPGREAVTTIHDEVLDGPVQTYGRETTLTVSGSRLALDTESVAVNPRIGHTAIDPQSVSRPQVYMLN